MQEFISEVSHEGITGEGNEANEGTAIRFLRARKFDIERAVSLYNAHKVCQNLSSSSFHFKVVFFHVIERHTSIFDL